MNFFNQPMTAIDAVCVGTGLFVACVLYPLLRDGAKALYEEYRWRKARKEVEAWLADMRKLRPYLKTTNSRESSAGSNSLSITVLSITPLPMPMKMPKESLN